MSAGFAGALMTAQPASADWPMARHDPKRTGSAEGTGNITEPAAYWRRYLGGSIGAMLSYDVDADGSPEIVYVAGGQLVMKRQDDTLVWHSAPLGIESLIGIDDLDGDSNPDIVAATQDHALVFAALDGTLEWAEPDGEMGTIGRIRMGDVSGDSRPDLVIHECRCCGVNSGNPGYLYSFGPGFVPTLLWSIPPWVSCGSASALTLVDVNDDGRHEVLLSGLDSLALFDGTTGAELAASANLGSWTSASRCRGVDVDAEPGEEMLCILNSSASPAVDQRKAYALKYDAATASLETLWLEILAPDAGGDLAWVDPFVDLDGDGSIEVVIAAKDEMGVWSTLVLDSATGLQLASLAGQRLAGTAPIADAGTSLVLRTSGSVLSAWRYSPAAPLPLAPAGTLQDRTVRTELDPLHRRHSELYNHVVTTDLNGDGVRDLCASNPTGSMIAGYAATGAGLVELGSHTFSPGVEAFAVWSTVPQLAVARSDGFLTVYDGSLKPMNEAPEQNRPGVQIGGHYANGGWRNLGSTPVIAALDGPGADGIIAPDSRNALLRLDPIDATLVVPPAKVWERARAFAPAIVPGLDGRGAGIACMGRVEPVTSQQADYIAALRPDGSEIWKQPIEAGPLNDLVPGQFDLDEVVDLVVQWGDPSDVILRTRAISGATGATIWNGPQLDPDAGRQPAGIAIGDFNGDDVDDVVHHAAGATRVLSGVDGVQIASGGPNAAYFLPTLFDINSDGIDEVTLHGSYLSARTLTHDLAANIWIGAEDDRPYPYGAVASCSAGPILVEGSWRYPSRLKLTRMSGPSAGSFSTMVLAGGGKFPNEQTAKTAGARMGQLTSANVHSNLTGASRPSALVGSSDGWLYAIDPCAGALDWSLGFDAAVGEAVFGDTDGDGLDEVIVSVADGYLYGLKHKAIDAPAWVLDVDPAGGPGGQDIDTAPAGDLLGCAWTAVQGASGYEVALVEDRIGYITSPPWQDAGTGLSKTISPAGALQEGRTYRCAVRAVAPGGAVSPDTASDGITLTQPSTPGAGGAGGAGGATTTGAATDADDVASGCACRAGSAGAIASPIGILSLLAAGAASRPRRRRQ